LYFFKNILAAVKMFSLLGRTVALAGELKSVHCGAIVGAVGVPGNQVFGLVVLLAAAVSTLAAANVDVHPLVHLGGGLLNHHEPMALGVAGVARLNSGRCRRATLCGPCELLGGGVPLGNVVFFFLLLKETLQLCLALLQDSFNLLAVGKTNIYILCIKAYFKFQCLYFIFKFRKHVFTAKIL